VRVAAVILGLVLFAGLIVMAMAGVSAATAVLITAGAVMAMIILGNAVGGRHTPNRSPYGAEPGTGNVAEPETGTAADAGTVADGADGADADSADDAGR
jgi:hypothetical protein